MSNLKTQPTQESVADFLANLPPKQQTDCQQILQIIQNITQQPPVMWGKSIVGFGQYQYEYKSGHTGIWFWAGFSPRKQNLTIYLMTGFDHTEHLLQQLGKHTIGTSCLYINKIADVNLSILTQIITESVEKLKKQYPNS